MPNMQEDGLVVQLHDLVRANPDFEVLCEPTLYVCRFIANVNKPGGNL
ncbi:MAG: hypothetical protein ACRD8U_05170 [Pyrinomonadaceae bacterium]